MNRKLTLLTRAHMSILAQIRHFADTPYEDGFRSAAYWVRQAMGHVQTSNGGELACLENAAAHLGAVRKALGVSEEIAI